MSKIAVIYNSDFTTKEKIEKELKQEEYKHDFFFCDKSADGKTSLYIKLADEVWTWGNCKNINLYKIAESLGKDIWVMG